MIRALARWTGAALAAALAIGCVGPIEEDRETETPDSQEDEGGEEEEETGETQAALTCPVSVTYADSMVVGPIPACSQSYVGQIDDCYNTSAPPLPSVLRNYVTPVNPTTRNPNGNSGAIAFPNGPWDTSKPFLLPGFRTTNDGRVTLLDGARFGLFLPENAGYDLMPNASASRRAVSATSYGLHYYHVFNPLDTRLAVAVQNNQVLRWPDLNHTNICDDSGSGFSAGAFPQISSKRNPRPCSAPFRTGTPAFAGDCYDITLTANITLCTDPQQGIYDAGCPSRKWEIRSADLTLFVPNARKTTAGQWSLAGISNPESFPVWVYPRQPSNQNVLPAYDGDGTPDSSYNVHASNWGQNYTEAQRCYLNGVPPTHAANAPKWCELLWNQKHTPNAGFYIDADGNATDNPALWDGVDSNGLAVFEPTTTGDGRLLIVNAMHAGLVYSYISPGVGNACDASKWTHFRPLSRMPRDFAVQDRYEITRAQMLRDAAGNIKTDSISRANARLFRDTTGQNIPAGSPIPGAYLWIDRQGRNAIFSHAPLSRTGYKAKQAIGYCTDPTNQNACGTTPVTFTANTPNDLVLNPDRTAGKGQSLLGAWTQGKIIHLDNSLNMSDWGGRSHWFGDLYQYHVALYDECTPWGTQVWTYAKPKSTTEIFSFENMQNHFDALNPALPFDVVWRAQGNSGANAEIVFDDYVRNNALIVAHMNPAIDIRCGNTSNSDVKCTALSGTLRWANGRILDGFLPQNSWAGADNTAWNSNDRFMVDPTLQNAATSSTAYDATAITPPTHLRLRGGARVEPINAGGVLGRGVYLDGKNDIIDAAYPYQANRTEWWIGVWLDSRDLATLRTVFYLPDESSVALKNNSIVVRDGPRFTNNKPGANQTLSLPAGLISESKFFHLGLKLTTESGNRVLRFSIDGVPLPTALTFTPVAGVPLGFQLMKSGQANGYTWFALGGCTTDPNLPWKGWVDELKVYSIGSAEIANANGFHDEIVCNHALGTQVDLSVQVGETPNAQLTALRNKLALYGYTHPGSGVANKPIRASICEQLDLVPDGTRGELPRQHDGALLCAHRAHKNQTSNRCVRDLAFGNVAVTAQAPLPSFSSNTFCLGCHKSDSPLDGLRLSALSAGVVAAEQDARRRPSMWPAVVTGDQYSTPTAPFTRMPGWNVCDPNTSTCTALDRTFLPAGTKWYFP